MGLCNECMLMLRTRPKLNGPFPRLSARQFSATPLIANAKGAAKIEAVAHERSRNARQSRFNRTQSGVSQGEHARKKQHSPRDARRQAPPPYSALTESDVAQVLDSEMTLETKRRLRMELAWLKDPAKLAQSVERILATGNLQKALNLVRLASADDNKPIVAWNRLLAYIAGQRAHKSAFRLFNEMKKRGQFPDSYTVVHLLRGLALQPVGPEQVRLALHLLDSLEADNSRIQKHIIHTNAAMLVCARAFDLDSMWTLISKIPERGRAAADQYTFSTIFTALRNAVESKSRSDADYEAFLTRILEDGRGVWKDALRRWRADALLLDERMVSNYVRLIQLDLSESTMHEVQEVAEGIMGLPPPDSSPSAARARTPRASRQVTPGNYFLSVLLDILGSKPYSSAVAAQHYWKAIVEAHKVIPDRANYRTLLRILAIESDSESAVSTIMDMVAAEGQASTKSSASTTNGPTYVECELALNACSRRAAALHDATSVEHANKIFEIMTVGSFRMLPKSLARFVHCAVASHRAEDITASLQQTMPLLASGRFSFDGLEKHPSWTATLSYLLEVANTLLSEAGRREITATCGSNADLRLTQLKQAQQVLEGWLRVHPSHAQAEVDPDPNAMRTLKGFQMVLHKRLGKAVRNESSDDKQRRRTVPAQSPS